MTAAGADEARQTSTSISVKVGEILTLQRRPPPLVGHGLGNALILEDAFRDRITLPMQFCFSQDVGILYKDLQLKIDG